MNRDVEQGLSSTRSVDDDDDADDADDAAASANVLESISAIEGPIEEDIAIGEDTSSDSMQYEYNPSQPNLPSSFARNLSALANRPPTPQTKAPKDALKAVYRAGQYKAALTLDVLTVQSCMAGIYIALAGHLFLAVGGGVLGAAFFPVGLIAVLLTSGELFTGDALIFVASLLGGKVTVQQLARNWTVSWICNFVGCLAWAYFMAYLSDAIVNVGQAEFTVSLALKKANQPWGQTFLKGIGANFMVCLGVWQFTTAEEVAGKVLALWFPITGFVVMGFDHCIANQFFLPLGMMLGADISVYRLFILALLPATLGNLIGGGLFIGAVYWYVFDSMDSANSFRERIHHGWKRDANNVASQQQSVAATPSSSLHPTTSRRGTELFRRMRRQPAPETLE